MKRSSFSLSLLWSLATVAWYSVSFQIHHEEDSASTWISGLRLRLRLWVLLFSLIVDGEA
jgi:hypothetical protein